MEASVSVIIPALRRPIGLEAWLAQPTVGEVLILANGNFEGVPNPDPRVRLRRVNWEGHGKTRQAGVDQAQFPFVLLTVDDALPIGETALHLRNALVEREYEAVYARQLPWPQSDPVTRARLLAWTPPGTGPEDAPPHPIGGSRHDHVAALYRRETLQRYPLPSVGIAEDWHWARRHRIGYQPLAQVMHAHPRHFWPLLQRTRATHREFLAAGFPPTVPNLRSLLLALPGVLGPDFPGALGELLGQWAAARGHSAGGRG